MEELHQREVAEKLARYDELERRSYANMHAFSWHMEACSAHQRNDAFCLTLGQIMKVVLKRVESQDLQTITPELFKMATDGYLDEDCFGTQGYPVDPRY